MDAVLRRTCSTHSLSPTERIVPFSRGAVLTRSPLVALADISLSLFCAEFAVAALGQDGRAGQSVCFLHERNLVVKWHGT